MRPGCGSQDCKNENEKEEAGGDDTIVAKFCDSFDSDNWDFRYIEDWDCFKEGDSFKRAEGKSVGGPNDSGGVAGKF